MIRLYKLPAAEKANLQTTFLTGKDISVGTDVLVVCGADDTQHTANLALTECVSRTEKEFASDAADAGFSQKAQADLAEVLTHVRKGLS